MSRRTLGKRDPFNQHVVQRYGQDECGQSGGHELDVIKPALQILGDLTLVGVVHAKSYDVSAVNTP